MYNTMFILFVSLISTIYFVNCSTPTTSTPALIGRSYLEPYLNKKYELASSDNFDAVMEALGVGFLKRKMGNLARPVMELTEDNGLYTLSSKSSFKDVYVKFHIGEEFDEVTPDDREVRSIVTQDGNVLTHTQRGDKTVVTIREFTTDTVKVTVLVDDIVSVRIYKAV